GFVALAAGAAMAAAALASRGARRRTRAAELGPSGEPPPTPTREQLQDMLGSLSEAVTVTDAARRLRYANQAAADLLGCATPEELLARPLGTIFAQWESTHEDGRPMVAEDVPSYKIVNGQPAEPLLTRIVNRETGEQRWRLVKAAPLRSRSGETMAVSVIEDVTEAKEAELRQRFLAQAGTTLSSSLDYEETLQRVAQLVVPGLADWCAVDVVDANQRLNLVAVAHVDPDKVAFARELRNRYPPDPNEDSGLYGVLRSGRPELYPELPDELLAQSIEDREQLETIRALGMRSVMLIPMDVAGRTIGVLTMVSAESGRAFDEDDLVFASDLARRAATAVENARLYTERAAAAMTLQESLLPARLPTMPGWALASSYAAGDTTVDVGGDFFDVVELDEGFLAVVGDVTGKGVQAAALTALARYTLATAARFDPSPAAVVSLLNDVLVHRPNISLLTVACAHVVPTDGGARLRLTSAGHPLPVLSRPGHAPTTIGPPGLLLGMTGAARWEESEIELHPGDTLLFYTDGVTDTPSGGERFGEERLLGALPDAPAEPREMIAGVQRALREFQVGDVVDDRAMLALRLVGVGEEPERHSAADEPKVSVT
ncbi:MAG TPA: SpoIIE family protein phosphatase, partial [Solirubrobacteraceae bacterium]